MRSRNEWRNDNQKRWERKAKMRLGKEGWGRRNEEKVAGSKDEEKQSGFCH